MKQQPVCPRCGKAMKTELSCPCGYRLELTDEEVNRQLAQCAAKARPLRVLSTVFLIAAIAAGLLLHSSGMPGWWLVPAVLALLCLYFGGRCGMLNIRRDELVRHQLGDFYEKADRERFGPIPADAVALAETQLRQSNLFNGLDWNEDRIFGMRPGVYQGTPFAAANVELDHVTERENDMDQDGVTDSTTREVDPVFHGVWLRARLPRRFEQPVYIRRRGKRLGKARLAPALKDTVTTDSAAFNEAFAVESDDPHAAFFILTPQFMEQLLAQREPYFLSFRGDMVDLAVETPQRFRDRGDKSQTDLEQMRRQYTASLDYVAGLLAWLQRNENLFGGREDQPAGKE